jgi:PAS domain S-box-containing protein
MPQSKLVTILIINEHAEETKLVTISLRGFFPDCRIDAAYSTEEATAMASATGPEWAVILIDDECLPEASPAFIEDLKRRTPYVAILVQSARTDSASALQALQLGADYFLCKHSPAFLTELLFCIKEALDKRDLRLAVDRAEIRHRQLVESLNDVFYELDSEGRFLTIGPNLAALLGYRPEELIGLPYETIFPQAQQSLARFRFNERRSGARAATGLELTLQGKPVADRPVLQATAGVTARGLYDPSRRFLGTVGIIRDLSESKRQRKSIQELHQQVERTEELRMLARQIATLSRNLQQPLSTLLSESQQLFDALRGARITDRVEALTGHAAAATQLGERIEHLLRDSSQGGVGATINHLLEDLLISAYTEEGGKRGIMTDFAASLPPYQGDRERTLQLFQRLLTYARTYLAAVGRSRLLIVKTSGVGLSASTDAPTLFPLAPPGEIHVEISESDREPAAGLTTPLVPEPIDLLDLYQRAGELGAALDVSAPAAGPLRMLVRLAIVPQLSIESTQPTVAPVPITPAAAEVAAPAQPHAIMPLPLPPVSAERRTTPRVSTTLPAKVTIGSSTWDGTLRNIGLGGACIGLPGDFPSIPIQESYIVVRTAAGILELSGLAYARTASTAPQPISSPQSHIIIVFHAVNPTEAAVLSSLVEAARERSLTFTIEVLLAAGPLSSQATGQEPPVNLTGHDRREAIRVPLSLPARLETPLHPQPASRLAAQVTNLSRHGACAFVKERSERMQGFVTFHFAPEHRSDQPGAHEPGAPATALPARLVWSAPDPTAPSPLHAPGTSQAARIGVRFQSLTPHAERELNRVIRQHMIAQRTNDTLSTSATVVSVPRECRNARGQTIAITDNHLRRPIEANVPTVIIAPGYGQTASDYAAFSCYLAVHRLRVLRYDHTNHIGTSEGELQHTTLRSMQHDLSRIVEFVRHTWPQAPTMVIASDLAARAALKMAATARPLDLLLLVNPSIEVGTMLMAVHRHDLVADYQFGLRRGVSNLLGLNVNVDQFVGDLIAGRFTDLESTLDDLRLVRSPLCIVTSPTTTLVSLPPADLPHAFITALGAQARLVNIPTSLTDQDLSIRESHPSAFKQMLTQFASVLPVPVTEPEGVASAHQDLVRQRQLEQEYTYLLHDGSQISREALCAAHLSQISQLGNLHEYRKLLDDLYSLMNPLDPGTVLGDAGIGESDLTRATLVNHTYRAGQAGWTGKPSPLMIGIGRSGDTIAHARHAVQTLQRELSTGFVGRLTAMPPLTVGWVQADWTESIPFKPGSLHRLVCNFSLSYVPSPLAALREWHGVLHSEGRLILTTFHPDTDLSTLYRRHLRQANLDEFSTQAQSLLHYFGRLREAIRLRILHVFDQAALSALLQQCGMTSFRIFPVFDGQALVAVVGKRNSSSSIR